jgi:flagellar FliL protein
MKGIVRILIVVVLGVVVGGGLTVAVLTGMLPVPFGPLAEARAAAEKARPPVTVMYSLKERVVNLADTGTPKYLKAQVTLEFIDTATKETPKGEAVKLQQEHFAEEMAGHSAVIDDRVITVLSSKSSSEVSTAAGKEALKQDLMSKLNAAMHDEEHVVNVYFTSFIVQ